MSVLYLRHPTDGNRVDTFHVNSSGSLIQKSYQNSAWIDFGVLATGAVAQSTPAGEWTSPSTIHIYCPATGNNVLHWWWDNGAHTALL